MGPSACTCGAGFAAENRIRRTCGLDCDGLERESERTASLDVRNSVRPGPRERKLTSGDVWPWFGSNRIGSMPNWRRVACPLENASGAKLAVLLCELDIRISELMKTAV